MTGTLGWTVGLLLGLASIASRPWRGTAIGVAYVASLAAFAAGPERTHEQLFTWIKIASLLPLGLAIVYRARRPWLLDRVIVAAIGLNVLEAVVDDALHGAWLNVLAGLALVITLPRPTPHAAPAVTWPWILTYTTWNFAFVLGAYPTRAWDHAAVLAAPVLVSLARRDAGAYLPARVWSLMAFALVVVPWRDAWGLPWSPDAHPPAGGAPAAAAVALVLAAWTVAAFIYIKLEYHWPIIGRARSAQSPEIRQRTSSAAVRTSDPPT